MPFKISYAALEEGTDQQHNLKELIQELIFALQDNIKTAVSKTGLLKSSISLLLDWGYKVACIRIRLSQWKLPLVCWNLS